MEEHGLTVTKDIVVPGDYSENIDELVEALLDNNPGLEAIAFANDNMAKAGYRVCGRHNLLIGKDIAITGFDNVDFAQSLTPPLTSVAHSSFFSYTALKNTLMFCRGRKPFSKRMPSILRRRCSCGCTPSLSLTSDAVAVTDFKAFILSSADQISMDIFSLIPYENMRMYYDRPQCAISLPIFMKMLLRKRNCTRRTTICSRSLNLLLGHHHISTELVLEKFTELFAY